MNKKDINITPSSTPVMDNASDAFEQVNKFGTYNIQPTADKSNPFPAIAHGLSESDKALLKRKRKAWLKEQESRQD